MFSMFCCIDLEYSERSEQTGQLQPMVSSLTKTIEMPFVPCEGLKIIFEPVEKMEYPNDSISYSVGGNIHTGMM